MTSEAEMAKEADSPHPVSRLAAVARAAGLALAYAATVTALALPVGVGYFAYQRWIGGRTLQETSLHLEDALLLLQAVAGVLGVLAALAWVRFLQRRVDRDGDLRALGLTAIPRGWARFGLGVAGGAVTAGILVALAFAAGDLQLGPSHWLGEGAADVVIDLLGALIAILCAVVGEELVFRGYVQWILRRAWPAWAAVLGSAVLFVGFRALLVSPSIPWLLNALAAGLLLAGLVRLTGSLHVSLGARMGWASVIGLVYSLPVGGSAVEGALSTLRSPGPAMDQSLGPEASWILLPLLGTAAVVILARSLRRPNP